MALKLFVENIKNNIVLRYLWVISSALIVFYAIINLIVGPATSFPEPWQILDLQGIMFLLLISFTFFLLVVLVFSLKREAFDSFLEKNSLIKLLLIHTICFVIALLLPMGIFIGVYIVAYFVWYFFSAVFLILFSQDLSVRLSGKYMIQDKKKGIMLFYVFWIVAIMVFGAFFMFLDVLNRPLNEQMILLAFPLFMVIVPIISFVKKPKSGNKPPITLFGLLAFLTILYPWLRYVVYSGGTANYSLFDAIIDIFLIFYIFIAITKNAQRISERLPKQIQVEQILYFFIWCRISSLILLLSTNDSYQIAGYTAAEGAYLATMFIAFIVGTVIGIIWALRGIKEEDLKVSITLPELTGELIK